MGLRPTQGDEKWVLFGNHTQATTLNRSAALPFVISTGAPKERSGEISVPAVLSWECFSTERTRISYFAPVEMTKGRVVVARRGLGKGPQISPLRFAPVEMTKGRVVMARSRG
jgi:hypothetical protein